MGRIFSTLALVLLWPALAPADERVVVVNLPQVQTIAGEVSVKGPIPVTRFIRLAEKVVPPVSRAETTAMVDGGTIAVDGFRTVVLSLSGFVQGNPQTPAKVAAILIPDEESLVRPFKEAGQIQLEIEVTAEASPGETYFAGNLPAAALGFPRYRIYYYNATGRPATVQLFAYLAN